MARRILNNAKIIIEYDNKEDTTRFEYQDARNVIILISDEAYIEFDTSKGKASIPIKEVIDLIYKEKGKMDKNGKMNKSKKE